MNTCHSENNWVDRTSLVDSSPVEIRRGMEVGLKEEDLQHYGRGQSITLSKEKSYRPSLVISILFSVLDGIFPSVVSVLSEKRDSEIYSI